MKTAPLLLRFRERVMQGPLFHLTTIRVNREPSVGYHTHDYHEIFWINRGRCRHYINGTETTLAPGTVVLVRDTDAHSLHAGSRGGLIFTNLALAPEVMVRLQTAYPEIHTRIYRSESAFPESLQLTDAGRDELDHRARELAKAPHDYFHIEQCVMGIWALFLRPSRPEAHEEIPAWLSEASRRIEEPEVFCEGVPGFVAAAGRSHEHLSRETRRWYGKTPSQMITDARLRRAAFELRLSQRSVTEIALDCGYADPAQFFRVFRARYGTTPRRYRSGIPGRS